jgi:hypothetical protein
MFFTRFTATVNLINKYNQQFFRKATALLILIIIIGFNFLIQACVSCPDNNGNIVKASFFNQGSNVQIQPYNQIYLQERDTILPFDVAELKLDVERKQSTYILSNTTNGLSDTIVFSYNSAIEYLDHECGIQFEISDFRVNSSFREARIIRVDKKINEWEIQFFR